MAQAHQLGQLLARPLVLAAHALFYPLLIPLHRFVSFLFSQHDLNACDLGPSRRLNRVGRRGVHEGAYNFWWRCTEFFGSE